MWDSVLAAVGLRQSSDGIQLDTALSSLVGRDWLCPAQRTQGAWHLHDSSRHRSAPRWDSDAPGSPVAFLGVRCIEDSLLIDLECLDWHYAPASSEEEGQSPRTASC